MLWVVVMAVIAVLGLLMLVGYARWLWHKATDLMAEVDVVTGRLNQLGELLAQIQPPDRPRGYGGPETSAQHPDDEDDEDDDWAAEARALRLGQQSAEKSLSASTARLAGAPDADIAT